MASIPIGVCICSFLTSMEPPVILIVPLSFAHKPIETFFIVVSPSNSIMLLDFLAFAPLMSFIIDPFFIRRPVIFRSLPWILPPSSA
ncbi:hypothetical protein [Bartonella gliris]|uniref:hypothetical protein n=1 Tax=Bartonella gliris TaxID=3004109 RepID=UPI00295EEE43|nr:hypothetical protein [Bartonella gliris]